MNEEVLEPTLKKDARPTLAHAWTNMEALLAESGVKGLVLRRALDLDPDEGAWPFEVLWKDKRALVWMPGISLSELKISQRSAHHLVPRVTVRWNDWLWPYAVEAIREMKEES